MNVNKIPLRKHMYFLPSLFGYYYITGELLVNSFLDKYAQGHNRAPYEFMKAENGAMYLKPDSDYVLTLPNYFNETISADICGIIATYRALGSLIHKAKLKSYEDPLEYALLEFLIKNQEKLDSYFLTLSAKDYDRIKFAIS